MTASKRLRVLDFIRGFALVNMILYHALWDVVYIFEKDIGWYTGPLGEFWQKSICICFIFLSGYCWHFVRKKLKRGLIVTGCSLVITIFTLAFMRDSVVIFGVLTLLGVSAIIMIPLDKLLKKIKPWAGFIVFLLSFVLSMNLSDGYVGFKGVFELQLPQQLYANYFSAFLGFPFKSFYSSDYFPVIPWFFLYASGYFFYEITKHRLDALQKPLCRGVEWLGRHSLVIYMLHQPLVYGILYIFLS